MCVYLEYVTAGTDVAHCRHVRCRKTAKESVEVSGVSVSPTAKNTLINVETFHCSTVV